MVPVSPPRRAYDSRNDSPLAANTPRRILLGVTGKAAMVNLTVVQPAGNGNLVAWGDGAKPVTANVNFQTGVTEGNAAIVPLVAGGIMLQATVQTHVVVDVQAVWP